MRHRFLGFWLAHQQGPGWHRAAGEWFWGFSLWSGKARRGVMKEWGSVCTGCWVWQQQQEKEARKVAQPPLPSGDAHTHTDVSRRCSNSSSSGLAWAPAVAASAVAVALVREP